MDFWQESYYRLILVAEKVGVWKISKGGGGWVQHPSLLCTFRTHRLTHCFLHYPQHASSFKSNVETVSGLSKRKLFASIQPFRYDIRNSNQGLGYVSQNCTDNTIQVVLAAYVIKRRRWITCPAECNTRISGRNAPLRECISRKNKLRVLRRICGPKAEDVSGVRGNRVMRSLIIWITE